MPRRLPRSQGRDHCLPTKTDPQHWTQKRAGRRKAARVRHSIRTVLDLVLRCFVRKSPIFLGVAIDTTREAIASLEPRGDELLCLAAESEFRGLGPYPSTLRFPFATTFRLQAARLSKYRNP